VFWFDGHRAWRSFKAIMAYMAALPEPILKTVEQYRQLPEREDVIQELHWGQVVALSRPKMKHAKLQSLLVRL